MTYLIETYGCQMNKAESAALESIFRERGWTPATQPPLPDLQRLVVPGEPRREEESALDDVDLVLINTCSVRATAENRAWGRIDRFAALKRGRAAAGRKSFALVVTGCMAERLKRRITARQPAVDYVVGTFQKQAFGLVLDAVAQGRALDEIEESPAFVFARSYYEPGSFRSFVPIMHGCDNYCSYCIVPYLRGHEVSRRPADILAEIDALEDSGVREITLLGQNVNSYRWKGELPEEAGASASDLGGSASGLDFPGLLRLVSAHLRERGKGGIRWVRFLTSHPKDLSDELIGVLAEDELFCRHVHLCVQSGSDRILAAMNRRYTAADYLDLAARMEAAIPGLSLSTDILVGFPGETEEDNDASLELMERVRFAYSFMYHFNPRDGTPAASLPDRVSEKVKRERLSRVIALQKRITGELMRARIGCEEEVLVEGLSRRSKTEVLGRTQRDEMVVFPAPASRVGGFARVKLTGLSGNTFRAEEI
ncbi:MAG TPA: tRNA (N6-isopentenyl adenosine(37)-C2)-methylthiotransferase MiaB [Rectinemataceae bacterium]|nr:tRNA (N6-isopentenyl adenosine(37)-C2)-methylthiotransferase MiaB [Rectinemataceae bacterium]